MSALFNVHEAKTQLSKLLRRVERGEEIVIARNGEPVARLTQLVSDPGGPRPLGTWRGQVEIAEDFDTLPDEFVDTFYTSLIEPDGD